MIFSFETELLKISFNFAILIIHRQITKS